MKRIAMLLSAVALLMGQKGFANNYCEPCFNWRTDISYSVYADYLFWKVTRDDNILASTGPDSTTGITFIDPSYQSGYRVGAALLYSCMSFDARYTSFRPSDAQNLAFPIVGAIPPSRVQYDLNYQTVDLALGYTRHFQCHRGYVKPYVGAKLAFVKETTEFTPGTFVAGAKITNSTHAYGPMIGVEGSWELFRYFVPVSLVARGDLSIVSSKSALAYNVVPTTPPGIATAFAFNNAYSFVAVQDIFLGLGVDICNCWCVDANIQVGYEAQIWNGIRRFGRLTDESIAGPGTGTLGLGGLVVRAGLTY